VRIPLGARGALDITSGQATSGGVTSLQRSVTLSKLDTAGKEVVSKGTSEQISIGKTYFSQKPFMVGGSQEIKATTEFIPSVEGLSIGIPKIFTRPTAEFNFLLKKGDLVGKGTLIKGGKFEPQKPVLNIGVKKGDMLFGTGGQIKMVGLDFIDVEGASLLEKISIKGTQEFKSTLKIIKPKTTDKLFGSKITGGKKTPFSDSFEAQTSQVQSSTFSLPPIRLPTQKIKQQTDSLLGIPRSVGGLGLTDMQITKGQGFAPSGIIETTEFRDILTPPKSSSLIQKSFLEPGIVKSRSGVATGLIDRAITKPVSSITQVPILKSSERLIEKQLTEQTLIQKPLIDESFITPPPSRPAQFEPLGDFGFIPPFALPKFLGGGGDRKVKKKRAKSKVPIRPSFTGIVLGIEEAATPTSFAGIDLGILPGQIRGLETGFEFPKKKKKTKKKKK